MRDSVTGSLQPSGARFYSSLRSVCGGVTEKRCALSSLAEVVADELLILERNPALADDLFGGAAVGLRPAGSG